MHNFGRRIRTELSSWMFALKLSIYFLLGLPKGSPSLKMPLVIFVLVFYLQSQIAVLAQIRMRMFREHLFLPPLEGIFLPLLFSLSAERPDKSESTFYAYIYRS